MEIIAVVVTYKRPKLLKKCIEAIILQTQKVNKIIVFNNNSNDETETYLSSLDQKLIHCIHSETNVGGAGGFHYGIKAAYEMGAEWIWAMDDDTIPLPDALEKMVTSEFFPTDEGGAPTGFLASRVDWLDGNRHLMNYIHPIFPWHHFHGIHDKCYRILNCSFVSVLINRQTIQTCGYPIKEFFIWGDDWEYTGRITSKYRAYYISDSVVIHETHTNAGTDYTEVNQNNIWKYKYCARNNSALRVQSFLTFIELIISLIRDTKRMYQHKIAFQHIFLIWIYSIRGAVFNYQKYIERP